MMHFVCGPNDLLAISRVNAWHACIMNVRWLLLEYIKDLGVPVYLTERGYYICLYTNVNTN